jgi:leader peptidase (prepilin peptidase)/N-methyltransferase
VSVGEALIGATVSSGSIWLAGWLYEKVRHREGLGFGDVKMIFMIGAFLGLPGALLTLIAASLVGAIGGLLFIYFAKKDAATYELPFGSFLGVSALAVAVYSEIFARLHPH